MFSATQQGQGDDLMHKFTRVKLLYYTKDYC